MLPTEEVRMAEPIHQEVTIDAAPADVYAALTEAARFAEVTAAPASMEASPGGAFSLFNGMIEGRNIELASGRRIVQAWRVKNWPAGRVGEAPITPELVLRLGYAAGHVLTEAAGGLGEMPAVLIGKDTRISGYLLEAALEAGLSAANER